jgi:hypothetical protein
MFRFSCIFSVLFCERKTFVSVRRRVFLSVLDEQAKNPKSERWAAMLYTFLSLSIVLFEAVK